MRDSVPGAQGSTPSNDDEPRTDQLLCSIHGEGRTCGHPSGLGCPHALSSRVLALAQSPHCRQTHVQRCSWDRAAAWCCW